MNLIDLAVLLVLLVSILFGMYRGSIASLLGLFSCCGAILLGMMLAPRLTQILASNQGVTNLLATYTDAASLVGDFSLANTSVSGISTSQIQAVLKSVNLPSGIAVILQTNLQNAVFSVSGYTTVNQYVTGTLILVMLQIFSFVLCFGLFYIFFHLLINLFNHVFHYPVLKQGDILVAGLWGLIRGIFVVYVLFLILPVFQTILPETIYTYLTDGSSLYRIFYSESFLLKIIS